MPGGAVRWPCAFCWPPDSATWQRDAPPGKRDKLPSGAERQIGGAAGSEGVWGGAPEPTARGGVGVAWLALGWGGGVGRPGGFGRQPAPHGASGCQVVLSGGHVRLAGSLTALPGNEMHRQANWAK